MIRLEGVSKSFLINGKETGIINNVDLRIREREIFGLVGETASGKSTILRLELRKLRKDMGMIFQSFNLLGNLNVMDNILLPTKLRKEDRRENTTKARELLNFVGLSEFENAHTRNLSGGQKQRVAIARTLITDPKIIFCDEPTSALDDKMSYEILKLLKNINERFGTTIVLVSHDISIIKALCSRVAIIGEGSIVNTVSLEAKGLSPISYREALLND